MSMQLAPVRELDARAAGGERWGGSGGELTPVGMMGDVPPLRLNS